jgi:hypothetical protein
MGLHADFIELQLAHVERNRVRARTTTPTTAERASMMQTWADWLDVAAAGGSSTLAEHRRCSDNGLSSQSLLIAV